MGAPRGKELDLPGRHDEDEPHIFIGIDWLESVAFGHVSEIGERVLIIGVGNTAMDCCRTSRRLGGRDIKVMEKKCRVKRKGLASTSTRDVNNGSSETENPSAALEALNQTVKALKGGSPNTSEQNIGPRRIRHR